MIKITQYLYINTNNNKTKLLYYSEEDMNRNYVV